MAPKEIRKKHEKTIDIYRWYQNIDLIRISKVSTCLFWGCYMGIGIGVGEYDREFDVSGVGWYIASEMLLKPPWFSSDTPDSHQKCWWKTRKRDAVELHIITLITAILMRKMMRQNMGILGYDVLTNLTSWVSSWLHHVTSIANQGHTIYLILQAV